MDTRQRTTWGSRFRFLARFIGLAGLLAAATGAVLAASVYPDAGQWTSDSARAATDGADGDFAKGAVLTLAIGLAGVAIALVVELFGVIFLATSRRTAAETTALVATAAIVLIAVFVNAYSFSHYRRADLTREKQFTLPGPVADDLRKLRPDSPTTIVVFQQHKTSGNLTGKPDSYDYAAERKVVEKVKDLVDQFREFGPRFHVAVLDVEEEGYERQIADLTKDAPELKAALDSAPENSIFFHANKRVQRLGFNEFLQLDKSASKSASDGRGNLVLMPQGVERFARRVLAVQERRPKVAIAVIHGYLGTDGIEDFTHKGLKKTLTEYGFDVTDVVLKKGWGAGEPEPAAYTREESKLEELEGDLDEAANRVRAAKAFVAILGKVRDEFPKLKKAPTAARIRFYRGLSEDARNLSWLEVVAVYRKWEEKLAEDTESDFVKELTAAVNTERMKAEQNVVEAEKERRAADDKVKVALKDERPIQDRRMTDVKAKFAKLLADVDLLVIPRYTITTVTTGREIPPELHAINKDQVEAIRDYMKTGRPLLALMGPISEPSGPSTEGADGFEKLLAERGIELGRDTIVFDAEARMLAARGVGNQFGGAGPTDIPPLSFVDRTEGGSNAKPNPIGEAVRLTGRSVEQNLDFKLRALRPVYLADGWQAKVPFAAEFVMTGAESWNELKPFPLGDRAGRVTYVPRFDPPAADDKLKGSHAQERRGPFPVAVAVESQVPAEWFDEEYGRQKSVAVLALPFDRGLAAAGLTAAAAKLDRPNARLVVFGSGGVFVGNELKPVQEKLLLHSVNWLVNRPDRLPAATENAWSYPRVDMSERETTIWRGTTGILMPLAAVFLGLFAVMLRRTR